MRSVLVDGRVVVVAEDGIPWGKNLPRRNIGAMGGGKVIPVEDDWRLSLLHRCRGGLDRGEITLELELMEEVDSCADVIGRSAVGQRGHHDPVERRVRLGGITVEGHFASKAGAQQVLQRGYGGGLRPRGSDGQVTAR